MSVSTCTVPDCEGIARPPGPWCSEHVPEGPAGVTHLDASSPPTDREENSSGYLVREEWRCATGLSRIGGPALIEYDERIPRIVKTAWYLDGFLHRDGGPAVQNELSDDSHLHTYARRGLRHRENGPAEIFLRGDLSISSERYYVDGDLHRLDGPASSAFRLDGSRYGEEFFVFGHRVTPEVMQRCREAIAGGAPKEWAIAYATGEVRQ